MQIQGVASLAGIQILLELIASLPLVLIAGVGVYFDWWSWRDSAICCFSFMSIFSIFPLPFFLRNWFINCCRDDGYFHRNLREEESEMFLKRMEKRIK